MKSLACLIPFLLAATAYAAPPASSDPPAPQPAPVAPTIHLPPDNPAPPAPKPGPVQPTKLTKGVLYEITSSVPLFIVASPDGMVKISAPKTPVTIFGTFIDPAPADDNGRTFADGCVYLVQAAGVGKVELIVSAGLGTPTIRRCLLVDDGSVPVPPTPPTPPTPPKPPTPPLPPDPFMSAKDTPAGMRALILFSEGGKLTAGQSSAIYGAATRAYLNAHAIVGADGKTHQWRIWPDAIDASNDDPIFAKAKARPHASLPWILIGNGVSGYEGPLPEKIEDTTALLNKFGGN